MFDSTIIHRDFGNGVTAGTARREAEKEGSLGFVNEAVLAIVSGDVAMEPTRLSVGGKVSVGK